MLGFKYQERLKPFKKKANLCSVLNNGVCFDRCAIDRVSLAVLAR